MLSRTIALSIGLAFGLAAGTANAAVVDAQPAGFQVKLTATVKAPPGRVYAALGEIGRWWSSAHSFSGDARNYTLDLKAGGCFCEALPGGGSAEHQRVVLASPGKALVMRGALGPLQTLGVEGAMQWTIKPSANGSDVALTYTAGGYAPGGLDKLAGPVDGVLGEQLARFKAYVETGKPAP